MIPCVSKTLFGVDCLGCGFQRGFFLLLKGDFVAAFEIYPALYAVLIFVGILGLHISDKTHNYKKPLSVMAIISFVFMVVGYYYKHF
jgi:hypothetical protein